MEIPDENVFVEEDIGYENLKALYYDLTNTIVARTRDL